jgi:HlyD family secretion protein
VRAVLVIAMLAACGQHVEELQLVEIKRADLVIGVAVEGELEAIDSTDIKPPNVDRWDFKVSFLADDGADIKAGEPLVAFDTSELERELETERNTVDGEKQKLENKVVSASLARREEALAIATAEAALRKATLKTTTPVELIASLDLEVAKLDEESAKIALQLATNKAAQARRADETTVASLRDRLAYATHRVALLTENLTKMRMMAPRDGTVIYPAMGNGARRKIGDGVWRMEVVLQVVGLSKMLAKGAVDEVDIARVAVKQAVTLRLDALPDVQLAGTVESIARNVRAKSEANPSKVIDIKVALAPTTAPLRPGMRFRGQVETERVPGVVVIPADAVFVTPQGPVAYRDADGSIETVKLGLGRRSDTMIEVTSGLAPGDQVSRISPDARQR